MFGTRTLEGKRANFPNPERTISINKLLKEGRSYYALKKPLDKESSQIRRNYNRSFKSIYDAKRYAEINKITGSEEVKYIGKDGKEHSRVWF